VKGLWECDIRLKTRDEVSGMAAAAALAAGAVRRAGAALRPGVPLRVIQERAELYALSRGASDVRVFTSLNATAVHGHPAGAVLRNGDLVTLDASVCRAGWYGDVAWTFIVGPGGQAARRIVAAAWEAAWGAVRLLGAGLRVSDLARNVCATARRHRASVAEECAGHGIGRALHEEPTMGYADPRVDGYLVPGMVFTVEPVLTAGGSLLREDPAGGGLVTADGSLAAHFELTVALFAAGPAVLSPACGEAPAVDFAEDEP
jgi:methionyl aminopeptidase